MRRHFGISLEAAVQPQTSSIPMVTLSLEDEEIIFDEARESGVQAEVELNEADRILEVSDALEDLAVITDQINEATPSEVALIQNSAQMAVAGTDIDPDEMIPVPAVAQEDEEPEVPAETQGQGEGQGEGEPTPAATEPADEPEAAPAGDDVTKLEVPGLEAYIGRKISTEGMREVATTLYRNLEAFLIKIWDSIVHFFHNIVVGIPRIMEASKKLRKAVSGLVKNNNSKSGILKITTGVQALHVGGTPVKNVGTLTKEIDSLIDISEYVFNTYTKEISGIVDKVASVYAKFNPANCAATVSEIRNAFKGGMFNKFPDNHMKLGSDGYVELTSKDYLGNVNLLCKKYRDDKKDVTDLAALERIRNSRIYVTKTGNELSSPVIEFKVLEPNEIIPLLNKVDALLKLVYDYDNGAGYKNLLATRTKLRSASATATATLAKFKDDTTRADRGSIDNAGGNMTISFYKGGLNFNQALAKWTLHPCGNMVSHDIAVIKSVLNLVRKSIATYVAQTAVVKV